MKLPGYWLTRPELPIDSALQAAFDNLIASARTQPGGAEIAYSLPAPKWQFLCYAAEQHRLALHGSGNPQIESFEPRQSNDLNEFGNRKAVYAAADGIWPMFFAIVDRERFDMSISNACIRVVNRAGHASEPYYFFSVSRPALMLKPWHSGTVYLLPGKSFSGQPPMPFGEDEVHIPQLASLVAVAPLARLAVDPQDFPFLDQIRGHDDARLKEYAQALQTGAPWPDD